MNALVLSMNLNSCFIPYAFLSGCIVRLSNNTTETDRGVVLRKVVHPNAQERADGRAPDCEVGTGVMLEHVPSVAIQANWLEKEPQDEKEDPGVYCRG